MGLRLAQSPSYKLLCLTLFVLMAVGTSNLQAQNERYSKPTWLFGVAGGANFNFYRGTTQQLTSSWMVPTAFGHGDGVGLYLAGLAEYQKKDSQWGAMLQIGYDNRGGAFYQVITPCNCIANLSTKLSYLTVEPSLRFAPGKGNFFLFLGPRLASSSIR